MNMPCTRCLLRDGRHLAFREYGDTTHGFAVLFFHGNLNSRLFTPAWAATQAQTEAAGARLIAVDRPGYGQSDFLSDRTYRSWPADVSQLADHLGLRRYAVLGFSSGGPNAMAVAARAAGDARLAACGLISPDGPYKVIGGDEAIRAIYGTTDTAPAAMARRTAANEARMRAQYQGMRKPDRRRAALQDLDEAVRQGIDKGPAQDGCLEAGDWGFALGDIDARRVPVLLWHGEEDDDVPVSVGRYVAEHIQGCEATFIPGESHTLLRRHWQNILEQLVRAAQQPAGRL
eukprot:g680.t1